MEYLAASPESLIPLVYDSGEMPNEPSRQRWIAASAVLIFSLLALGVLIWRSEGHLVIRPIQALFPADGRERAVLRVARSGGGRLRADAVTVDAINSTDVRGVPSDNDVEIWMRSPVQAGERRVRLKWGSHTFLEKIRFGQDDSDRYGDGLPDALRLHDTGDRASFRRWFWKLAEMQSELPEEQRAPEINDCAALLRYAYRESLKTHDAEWASAQHVGDVPFASVRQWRYPETMLGEGLFRVRAGPFAEGDERMGAFAQFADAHALMTWNTYRVGRDIRVAKPGDLIFYKQLDQNSPYHSMVITGTGADWVVYHTGPIGKSKGGMRQIRMDDLLQHPDARWRPVAENSNFLGVFRWNLLREGE